MKLSFGLSATLVFLTVAGPVKGADADDDFVELEVKHVQMQILESGRMPAIIIEFPETNAAEIRKFTSRHLYCDIRLLVRDKLFANHFIRRTVTDGNLVLLGGYEWRFAMDWLRATLQGKEKHVKIEVAEEQVSKQCKSRN